MFKFNGQSGDVLLAESAKGAIPFLFWASTTITAIGFTILLGGLDFFLDGYEQQKSLQMIAGIFIGFISCILGYGFVRTEFGINLMWAIRGKVPPIAIIALVFIIATNLIIGIYRSNSKSAAETYSLTQQVVREDLIIQDWKAQKDSIQTNVYHDGAPSNDAAAVKEIGKLNDKIEKRQSQLVTLLKPVGDGTYNLFVLGILGFLSFVFSAAIQIAFYDEKNENSIVYNSSENGVAKTTISAPPSRLTNGSIDTSALIAKIAQAGYDKAQFAKIVSDAVFATVRENETRFFAKSAKFINEQYDLNVTRDEVRVFFIQETGLRNRKEIEAFLAQ